MNMPKEVFRQVKVSEKTTIKTDRVFAQKVNMVYSVLGMALSVGLLLTTVHHVFTAIVLSYVVAGFWVYAQVKGA